MKLKLFCLIALAWTSQARATNVTITITGTVYSGSDGSYNSRTGQYQYAVFGSGGDLTGRSFTLTLTFPDSAGTESKATCSSGLFYTALTGTSPGPSATLSIGSGSYNYGLHTATYSWETNRYTNICGNGNQIYVAFAESYTGSYSGSSSLGAANISALTSFTNADWRTNVFSVSASGNIHFGIALSSGGSTLDYASGSLAASNMSVNGIPANINIPIGEVTDWNGWGPPVSWDPSDPTVGGWYQVLTALDGGIHDFANGTVTEQTATYPAGVDTCSEQLPTSKYPPMTTVTGGSAPVNSADGWYDGVGWTSLNWDGKGNRVAYYRSSIPIKGNASCSFTVYQTMAFTPSGSATSYLYGSTNTGGLNTLVATIYATQVGSQRSGEKEQITNYP